MFQPNAELHTTRLTKDTLKQMDSVEIISYTPFSSDSIIAHSAQWYTGDETYLIECRKLVYRYLYLNLNPVDW